MEELSDITYKKGNTYPFTITIINKATGLPINTNGKTFTLMVNALRAPITHDDDLFKLVGVNDRDAASGKVTFTPSAIDNGTVVKAYYEIEMTEGANVRTIADDSRWTVRL